MPKKKEQGQATLLKNMWWGMGLVVLVSGILYLVTTPRVATGYGMSDWLLAMGKHLGVAYSPGYPMYIGLLWIVMNLPLGQISPAYAGNLLSGVMAVSSVAMMYGLTWRLYERVRETKDGWKKEEIWERWGLATLSSLTLAGSAMFWNFGIIAERFALSGLLGTMIIWLLLEVWWRGQIKPDWKWWLIIVGIGLGVAHQWFFWFLMPFVIWLYWERKEKWGIETGIKTLLLGMGMVLLMLMLLYQYGTHEIKYAANFRLSPAGVWQMATTDYWGDGLGRVKQWQDWWNQEALATAINNLVIAGVGILRSFSWFIGLGWLVALGYKRVNKKSKEWSLVWMMTAVMLIGISWSLITPAGRFERGDLLGQFILVLILSVVWAWFGFYVTVKRLVKGLGVLTKQNRVYAGLGVLALAGVVLAGYNTWRGIEGRNMELNSQLYGEMLEKMDEDSLLVCFSFESCYSLIYGQLVEGKGTGITIVPFYYRNQNLVLEPNLGYFDYNEFPMVLFDIISHQVDMKRIYAVDLMEDYHDILGIKFGFINYIPHGYYGELARGIPDTLPTWESEISQKAVDQKLAQWDWWAKEVNADLAQKHVINGLIFMLMNQRQLGFEEMNWASNLYHQFGEDEKAEVRTLREALERTPASEFFVLGYQPPELEFVLGEIDKLVEFGAMDRALTVSRGAVMLEPKSAGARVNWAELLQQVEATESAIIEYKNALKLQPGDEEIEQKLSTAYESILGN